MIQQPLKEYLQKLVAYNMKHVDYTIHNHNLVSTQYTVIDIFTQKHQLIKRSRYIKTILDEFSYQVFNKYMNDSHWIWK